jgi:hypothetical protein
MEVGGEDATEGVSEGNVFGGEGMNGGENAIEGLFEGDHDNGGGVARRKERSEPPYVGYHGFERCDRAKA